MIFCDRAGPTPEKALTSDTTETTRVERHSSKRMAARLEASGSCQCVKFCNSLCAVRNEISAGEARLLLVAEPRRS